VTPTSSRNWKILGGVAVVALIALAFVVFRGPSGSDAAASSTTTSADPGASQDSTAAPEWSEANAAFVSMPNAPIDVEISSTDGLQAGQQVSGTITSTDGTPIYSYEAYQCTAAGQYQVLADIWPTSTGQCISKPLSEGSQRHDLVAANPPNQEVDFHWLVGVGTDTYQLDTGQAVSVTCDKDNPCVLVLRVQVGQGWAFRTFPLHFA
jgi:hypothetical protein